MSLATLYTAEKLLVPWTAAPMDAAALFECPKWELTPKQQVTVAAYARELGNEQMQTGKHEEAFQLYKKALFMVEFDEDFHEDEEGESRGPLPALNEVHKERERCLGNIAAAALLLASASSDEERRREEGFAGSAKLWQLGRYRLSQLPVWRGFVAMGEPVSPQIQKSESTGTRQKPHASWPKMPIAQLLKPWEVLPYGKMHKWTKGYESEQARPFAKCHADWFADLLCNLQERAAQIEYNKRQLLFHIEKNKKKPDSEEEDNDVVFYREEVWN
ncbi:TANC1 [Symbiodinium natans]|uniref:TANC1 protein n=1 Tax=Symbiodinium natans TaxID=878477 RepID=A0A812TXP3_9DINO|nr:TANC1 [Symbiodinium natans]